ncbi:MAG: Ku protein, partial [Phenylobacterium sp.]
GDGLLLETLRYAEEIRESDKIFDDIPEIKPDKEMLDLAGELIGRKAAPFKPDAFKSKYADALRDLIKEKKDEGAVSEDTSSDGTSSSGGGKVVDLMDALKKSVGKNKTGTKKKAAPKSKSKSKSDKAA